jgi:peptidoglycan hydrolase CwlO-like protein
MAKYNAANHTIETDTGELLATLSNSVRADKAFEIADFWGADNTGDLEAEIIDLKAEIDAIESDEEDLIEANDKIEGLKAELSDAKERIAELEALLAEKGDAQ